MSDRHLQYLKTKMYFRSPIDNVLNLISGLPQGHDKPAKHALYNAIAIFVLLIGLCAGYALYEILQPFVKPLVWALLVGSVLHPFKCSLAKWLKLGFVSIEESGTPIVLGFLIVPVKIVDVVSEFIGSKLLKYIKYIIGIAITIPLLLALYHYTPSVLICIIWKIAVYFSALIGILISNATFTITTLIMLGYISLIITFWSPHNRRVFRYGSVGIWLLLSCFVAHYFYTSCQTPIFIALQIIFLGGFLYQVYDLHEIATAKGQNVGFFSLLCVMFNNQYMDIVDEWEQITEEKKVEKKLLEEEETMDPTDKFDNKDPLELTPKTKDPWSLDLFEGSGHELTQEKDHKLDQLEKELDINQKQKSHVNRGVKLSPASSEILNRSIHRNNFKLARSLSQPVVVENLRSYSHLLKYNKHIDISKNDNITTQYSSDFFLYSVFWACCVMVFWKNLMLLPLFIIPCSIYAFKHIGIYLGLWSWLHGYWHGMTNAVKSWCLERYDALIPVPVQGLYKCVEMLNGQAKMTVKESINTVATCVVILGLLIFFICASIFVAIQIYAEAIMLVQVTGEVINNTIVHNPELRQLLPATFEETVDSVLDNAYQYGRDAISKLLRGIMNDVDSVKFAKLEKQVLELWDRLYQTWMSSDNVHGPKVTISAVENSWDAFKEAVHLSPDMLNINGATDFVKQNIGTFMSLFESIWLILKSNISILLGSFSAFMSVLLGGGTAVLNFFISAIVFLTALFYLLSSSGELYKPVELVANFSTNGSRFILALGGAVNGVFTATFKMATFYGMWTWLIHNCFAVKIVYLPTACATILGAVPFLGTYWACIPAVLDIWLAQGKGFEAILFAIFQFLPMSIVDTTIYNEIQGSGHPYLTGLAIAGGIFCLGVEGAIIGPLLLCAVYVAMDLSSNLFKDTPEDDINIPSMGRQALP